MFDKFSLKSLIEDAKTEDLLWTNISLNPKLILDQCML